MPPIPPNNWRSLSVGCASVTQLCSVVDSRPSSLSVEPLAGWREVAVRETKTKVDWAIEMALLLEGRYADAERVIVVCDNLNTHTKGAFYQNFAPARARQLVRRIEFCYTSKHGSSP
jgi:hypothetical protein